MAYNDPMGEWIRPKVPDIFEKEKPIFPHRRRLQRRNSCPETPSAMQECKLANQDGYFLWDDLFKSMTKEMGMDMPTGKVTEAALTEAIDNMSNFRLGAPPKNLRSRSFGNIDHAVRIEKADYVRFDYKNGESDDHVLKEHATVAITVNDVPLKNQGR